MLSAVILNVVMLYVVMLNVVMLYVVMLNAGMLNVRGRPKWTEFLPKKRYGTLWLYGLWESKIF